MIQIQKAHTRQQIAGVRFAPSPKTRKVNIRRHGKSAFQRCFHRIHSNTSILLHYTQHLADCQRVRLYMPQLSRMMREHSLIWLKEYTLPPLMALISSDTAFLP